MANKPMSVAAALQEGLPKVQPPPGIKLKNRFDSLRDRSSSSVGRTESPSKRPRDESSEVTDRNAAFLSMAGEEDKLARAKVIVSKVKESLAATKERMNGPLMELLEGIVEWMAITTGVQETTANVVVDSYNKAVASPRKSRRDTVPPREDSVDPEAAALAAKKKKFVQEVREAEKSTLVFKTNMGSVPVMNPDTLKKRFTMDLVERAAKIEEKTDGRPTAQTAAQIDDVLCMVSKMEYFGKETKKTTRKKADGEEEEFYSIPVRLNYKDKETREAAEKRLRTLCKINATTPYHRTLRNVISKTIEESKKKYPGNFIQVKVDAEKFCLKVSRRENGEWFNNVERVELPDSVLDLSRHGPKASVSNDVEMADSQQSQG
jgi:predicted metal-dependent hydrolase